MRKVIYFNLRISVMLKTAHALIRPKKGSLRCRPWFIFFPFNTKKRWVTTAEVISLFLSSNSQEFSIQNSPRRSRSPLGCLIVWSVQRRRHFLLPRFSISTPNLPNEQQAFTAPTSTLQAQRPHINYVDILYTWEQRHWREYTRSVSWSDIDAKG